MPNGHERAPRSVLDFGVSSDASARGDAKIFLVEEEETLARISRDGWRLEAWRRLGWRPGGNS